MFNFQDNQNKFKITYFVFSLFFLILLIYKILIINQFPVNQRLDSHGIALGHIKEIFNSWYQYGYYPVVNDVGNKLDVFLTSDSEAVGQLEIDKSIRSHTGASILQGDFLRTAYVLPNYLLFNTVSPYTSNIIIFFIGIFLFNTYGFIKKKYFFTLLLSYLLILSDFYIYENFFNENIFGIGISLFLIVFSLYQLFCNTKKIYKILSIIFISILISIFTNVRTELSLLLFALLLLLYINHNFKTFIYYSSIALIIFFTSNFIITSIYFNKIERTNELIQKAGGVVYKGPFLTMHTLTHPIWIGLGDNKYGREMGFKWEDNVARVRVAEMRPDLYTLEDMCGSRICKYHDEHGVYPAYAEYIPGYQATLRMDLYQKFSKNPEAIIKIAFAKLSNQFLRLQDIHLNPNYLCIRCEKNHLLYNIKRLFFNELPPSKDDYVNETFLITGFKIFIFSAISLLIISIYAFFNSKLNPLITEKKDELSFILSSLPLAIPGLIISDLGATYNSIFHFGLLVLVFTSLFSLKKINNE